MHSTLIEHCNKFRVRGAIAYLTITRRDDSEVTVKFDAEDLQRVRDYAPWRLLTGRANVNYPAASVTSTKAVLLSRFILNTPDYLFCKIKNRNPLDCCKANLENVPYSKPNFISAGPYLYYDAFSDSFRAMVYSPIAKRAVQVGYYATADAARAAQREYVRLNPLCRVRGLKDIETAR